MLYNATISPQLCDKVRVSVLPDMYAAQEGSAENSTVVYGMLDVST